jgi:primosomal protein N' (replication factor Y)
VIARVVTDVAGLGKELDYLVPDGAEVEVGTEVRVPLGRRRVGGWVVGRSERAADGVTLRPLGKVRGVGPDAGVVDLARWAAWRWASRWGVFLRAASAGWAVVSLPPAAPPRPPAPPSRVPVLLPAGAGLHLIELAPATDPTPAVAAAAQRGPTLVLVPSAARASVLAERLRRAGAGVALLPEDWALARAGGAGVVVGARSAAFAPCPGLAAVVAVDAHDEGLVAEGAPTWSALEVAAERARRAGVPLYALTPAPTPELAARAPLARQDRGAALSGWAVVEVVDRRGDDPRQGLWSARLVGAVRDGGRVALVLNRTGRLRLLVCGACGELARCEACGAAVSSPAPGVLSCGRCGSERPLVCTACGSSRLRALRIGVGRAREELEALAGRPVGEVTGATRNLPVADVLVGTEALLHRLSPGSGFALVVFVDFDQELAAPRVSASSRALALLARAARVVGGRRGRVVVQTRQPDHPVVQSAVRADPILALEGDLELRRALRLPPFAGVAVVRGEAAGGWVAGLAGRGAGLTVDGPAADGSWLVRAPTVEALCSALAGHPRPTGADLKVAVEPAWL